MKSTKCSLLACLLLIGALFSSSQEVAAKHSGRVRTHYVAADEVDWDYAPLGIDEMSGMPFDHISQLWTEHAKDRIGKVYRKAVYREYTDASFTVLKKRPPQWEHLGLLGPVLRAEVGDTIRVVFKNNGTQAYSMHPHGVFYDKSSEGAHYNDGANDSTHNGMVPPGGTHIYIWEVPERAGPGSNNPSSVLWLYHSHNYEPKDTEAGLIGAILVTRRGMARPDGSPKDVDREFVTAFFMVNENSSWYLDHNISAFTGDPKSVNKLERRAADADGNFFVLGSGFAAANIKFTINGYLFGNMPVMTMHKGDRVRWYIASLGIAFHTPHWHGNVVTVNGTRADVVAVGPAQTLVADMVPDDPGTWMYHCHMSDHMEAGMFALYRVTP